MKCPECYAETNENPCSQCGKRFDSAQMNIHKNKEDDVLEPEIVDDNDAWNRRSAYSSQEQAGQTFRNYAFVNPRLNMNTSCLPSIISLALFLFVFMQLGFLAALGFVFFLLIGKAFSFYILLKNLSQGRFIPPILLDIVVWCAAYSLVAWLV